MVAAVRAGAPLRPTARRFGVSLSTLQQWVRRARGQRLDRVDWSDQAPGPRRSSQRTDAVLEEWIGELRRQLRQTSDLGEYGAAALRREWLDPGFPDPPVTHTIHRILRRRGRLDGPRRQRRPAPPPGWYLTEVAARRVERDRFDRIEGLALEGGAEVQTLTAVSLHGGLAAVTAQTSVETLLGHGRQVGLPGYAPFDNDTRFQGPRMDPDSLGRVIRLCLQWGVTPVFAPPLERGFQAAIESFNGRWQGKGGARFHPASRQALAEQSARYVAACRRRMATRTAEAPERLTMAETWRLDGQAPWRGQGIFVRRADATGSAAVLGHTFAVDGQWTHRLVRAEVDRDADRIGFYALRRREPSVQPLLRVDVSSCAPKAVP